MMGWVHALPRRLAVVAVFAASGCELVFPLDGTDRSGVLTACEVDDIPAQLVITYCR